MSDKYDLPNSLIQEYIKYNELFLLGSSRTSSGSGSWTSTSSSTIYNYTSGQEDLFDQLQVVLSSYMITAQDYNDIFNQSVLDMSEVSATPLAGQIPVLQDDDENLDGGFYRGTETPTGTTFLSYSGYFKATRVYSQVYNDFAEWFERGEDTEPGDIIMLNPDGEGYVKSRGYANKLVRGVHSDTYGMIVGGKGKDEECIRNYIPIALCGRVPVKIKGKAKKGDWVVSSDIDGVGCAVEQYIHGAVLGQIEKNKTNDNIQRTWMYVCRS